ncbi:MAG TPA: 30S ribosomal protein S20 [Fibrobacteria bacterium]|nr:30S ribosomal protein S20 [Fibrobacteria bacterium]
MPTHKSAEKRLLTAEKARLVNRAVRSAIRTSLKKVRTSATAEEAAKEVPNLYSMLDKAARRGQGGMTKNAASNYKSKVQKAIATIAAGGSAVPPVAKAKSVMASKAKAAKAKAAKAAKAAQSQVR